MLAVHGYYDGVAIKPLEKIPAKPNQRVIITIMDEFVEPIKETQKKRHARYPCRICRSESGTEGKERLGTGHDRKVW